MFTKIQHIATIGAAIVGVGWVTAVSPPVAQAQPPHIPPGDSITCPQGTGFKYLPDPDNSNGFYTCENGLEIQHVVCPPVVKLIWGTPPKCGPVQHHM